MRSVANVIEDSPLDKHGAVTEPAAIECRGLTKRFGRTDALKGLDIRVPRGSVYALIGRNGAGKSTLIQILMGMMEPTAGTVSVLGLDPIRQGEALKQRVGYIPDRLPMYDWMTVDELLRFVAAAYTSWSRQDAQSLVAQFRIDRAQKVGALSRGFRALLSLVVAIAHQPDLVLLDECTSGMDAIARREFERSVIDTLQASGRTVLFAGHQIDEMERMCDWVGVMKDGRLMLEMPIDELKTKVKLLRVSLTDGDDLPSLPGVHILDRQRSGSELQLTVRLDHAADGLPALPPTAKLVEEASLSLEEIFVALAGQEDRS